MKSQEKILQQISVFLMEIKQGSEFLTTERNEGT